LVLVERKQSARSAFYPKPRWMIMSIREGPPQPAPGSSRGAHTEPPPYPGVKARGAEIILRTRVQRVIFIGGLVGIVVLLLLLRLLA
jgi:hypothetical protein